MKTKNLLSIAFFSLLFLISCETAIEKPDETLKKEQFSGYVQKGPFLNGSSILISELDSNLNQTGRIYSTTVADNAGSFEQKQLELISNYVQLKADGYYFNEVSGESSSGQLTLYALADISKVNSANVNVLTHLEKSRVEYLVQQNKMNFAAAKKQAQNEVLDIFNLALSADSTSESLNLSAEGDNNAILLAVSCILQGFSTTAEMSELMGNIISDIKTDGKLDNETLGSTLIDNALFIDLIDIRKKLEAKYIELGLTNTIVPDFEEQVQKFVSKSTYKPVKKITYPVSGNNGLNLLNDTVNRIPKSQSYSTFSIKADLPKGTSLRIVLKGDRIWTITPNYSPQTINWTVNPYDDNTKSQEIAVKESNIENDLYFVIGSGNVHTNLTIEYYENNATTPTRIKTIEVGDPVLFTYPLNGDYGNNILNTNYNKTTANESCSMRAEVASSGKLVVIIRGGGTWKINGNASNWTVQEFRPEKQWQYFEVTETGKPSDLSITFTASGMYIIDIYENDDISPTRSKQFIII